MTYRLDPKRAARAPWERLLNNGHHFALCRRKADGTPGAVTMSARYAYTLKPFANWQPDLILIDVQQYIASLS